MTSRLGTRVTALERAKPRPDRWAGMDEVFANLTTPELRTLIDRLNRVKNSQPTTREQDELQAAVEDRLRAAGVVW